jgi:hypothetical protein
MSFCSKHGFITDCIFFLANLMLVCSSVVVTESLYLLMLSNFLTKSAC